MKPEKQLYQWDVNQYLTELQQTAEFVDYPIGNEVIRIKPDGTRCRIPDEVLQTYGGKTCYERYPDGTFRAYSFSVLYAPKPPDYVYTPEERTTFEALTARVDAAIDEIKRRADSGEFTPKKGVDYFTDAEKAEMMESVSDGAIGEFRNVVDTATTEYNANASEKLTTYDTNAEQHTTDYNRNAEVKLEAYNSNHAEKVTEYNQNAETKTAEFDSNAAALQTEVDRLRGECDNLAAENRKQENRIDALIKLNKGQTYDILPEEGETASRTAPSGAKYVGIDKVGGKSVVWNQHLKLDKVRNDNGITASLNNDRSVTINGTATSDAYILIDSRNSFKLNENHKYLYKGCPSGGSGIGYFLGDSWSGMGRDYGKGTIFKATSGTFQPRITVKKGNTVSNLTFRPALFDITQMFGSTIADYIYSLEQANAGAGVAWFKQMFPAESYPYNPGEIISSRTETITAGTEAITTGFPELKSAGTAHDEIDMDGGAIRRNVGTVDLGTLTWDNNVTFEDGNVQFIARVPGRAYTTNGLCDKFEKSEDNALGTYTLRTNGDQITFTAPKGTEIHAFVESMSGATLYYELATPTTEPVTIPEPMQEWLPVEAGGTVTFRNADDSKQLAVPNAVSWVRKLNEVN